MCSTFQHSKRRVYEDHRGGFRYHRARGRKIGQHVQEPMDVKRQTFELGSKEVGMVVGMVVIMLIAIWYGYSRQTQENLESQTATRADIAPVATTPSARPLTVSIQQSSGTTAPTPMPAQTESRHTDIYFDFGKSRLSANATTALEQQAQVLKDDHWAVLIQGYADQHGPAGYNKTLALRRAESVKQFLVELGVPESSMKVVSLGKDSTICDGQTPECRRLNRRVHMEMVKFETPLQIPMVPESLSDSIEPKPVEETEGQNDSHVPGTSESQTNLESSTD
jgi:peptidoglycan-associated lipoprotein